MGELIGIAAASSPFDKALFEKGVEQIKKWGFDVFFREDIFSKERYLAGSDERRAQELTELIEHPKIKAVFFARGGYGSQRVLARLDFDRLQKTPKPLIGFSDLTPLLNFLNQKYRSPALYGPVVTQLGGTLSERTLEVLRWHLTQKKPHPPFDLNECVILKEGKAEGKLAGGCLA
ncbi:MAG: LD-carboxypeptidase, partial [Deltaproteobacteria bacterium]|nr:LD-carboxypeptidase [Deltaproteobacteria bacterium]